MIKVYAFSDSGSNPNEPLDNVTREVNAFLEKHNIHSNEIISTSVQSSHVEFADGSGLNYLYTFTLVIDELILPDFPDEEDDDSFEVDNDPYGHQEQQDFARDDDLFSTDCGE